MVVRSLWSKLGTKGPALVAGVRARIPYFSFLALMDQPLLGQVHSRDVRSEEVNTGRIVERKHQTRGPQAKATLANTRWQRSVWVASVEAHGV